jgi:16S rRNA (cytosine967-C5)-methyltransferase
MSPPNARSIALTALIAVLAKGNSLDEAFDGITAADVNLSKFLTYGVLREYQSLEFLLNQLLTKPLKAKELKLKLILLLGLFQLKSSRIPEHAALHETVELAKTSGYDYASGLVNAVLRRFTREKEQLLMQLTAAHISEHPQWLLDKIKVQYPNAWPDIIAANNHHPPMHLRINQRKISREDYLKLLAAENINATAQLQFKDALTLDTPADVTALPGFIEGLVSVQDLAAQLAAYLLDLRPGQTVLDACAAPGGKSCHMLETCDIDLTCTDISAKRLSLVTENLQRLNLTAKLQCLDVSQPQHFSTLFDRILIDAPCSGTGVIRRHPDIKFLRQPEDIAALHAQQINIISQLKSALKPQGLMLYATCSILAEENDLTIHKILTKYHGFTAIKTPKLMTQGAQKTQYGYQFMPSMMGTDGFYYALLEKIDDF